MGPHIGESFGIDLDAPHQSDRYIWRYVKPDQQTLADAIDELE